MNPKRISQSEDVRKYHRGRRKLNPVIVIEGVGEGKLITLQPRDFKRLIVDERIQRIKITSLVNELIHVIHQGGLIADPITLAERPDGTLSIVDGQQRFWAHSECAKPMQAMVYKVKDFESERQFFIAMNHRKQINAKTTVKAWPGISGIMIREAAEKVDHPLYGKVNMGQRGHFGPFDSSIIAKGMTSVATGLHAPATITAALHRADTEIVGNMAALERAQAFLRLLPDVFPKGRAPLLAVVALGRIAYKRWVGGRAALPEVSVLNKFRRVNWDNVAPSYAAKYLALFERAIETRWPA